MSMSQLDVDVVRSLAYSPCLHVEQARSIEGGLVSDHVVLIVAATGRRPLTVLSGSETHGGGGGGGGPLESRHISSSPTFVRTEPLGSRCQSCVPSTMSNSHMNGFASPQSKFCHVPRLWISWSYQLDWPI